MALFFCASGRPQTKEMKDLFRQGEGQNLMKFIQGKLNTQLRGWADYFDLSQVKVMFEELDGWIRRKLRCVIWRQY